MFAEYKVINEAAEPYLIRRCGIIYDQHLYKGRGRDPEFKPIKTVNLDATSKGAKTIGFDRLDRALRQLRRHGLVRCQRARELDRDLGAEEVAHRGHRGGEHPAWVCAGLATRHSSRRDRRGGEADGGFGPHTEGGFREFGDLREDGVRCEPATRWGWAAIQVRCE